MLKDFGLKYIDIMIGVVLGLGFQWWPNLTEFWQYIAFIFIYLNLIDYWIDYSPTIKKFPLINQVDVILHTGIFFAMFLMVYYTQTSVQNVFLSFLLFRVFDILWILRMQNEYPVTTRDRLFMGTWLKGNAVEFIATLGLLVLALRWHIPGLILMGAFILCRVSTRILSSIHYKKVFYA